MGPKGRQLPFRGPKHYKFTVTKTEYEYEKYPVYMRGNFYVLSMSIVHKLALDCPYTCTGRDPAEIVNDKDDDTCFWKFEDVFIGATFSHDMILKTRFSLKLSLGGVDINLSLSKD